MTMAKLPDVDAAFIDRRKIIGYLLNPEHERGRDKAAFFASFGFTRDDWAELRDALFEHAVTVMLFPCLPIGSAPNISSSDHFAVPTDVGLSIERPGSWTRGRTYPGSYPLFLTRICRC